MLVWVRHGRPHTPTPKGRDVGAILETRGLRREFGALVAVDDVDLDIEERTLHSIIGPNGAGKTTLFNLISGTLRPTAGRVFYKGEDITDHPIHRTIHKGIGRSFQITNIFPNLTVLENVRLAVQAMGNDSFRMFASHRKFTGYTTRASEVLERVGLRERALQPAGTLPHGDQRKLELGMILAPDPDVLMLDEPTAGMAAEQVPQLMALVQEIQSEGNKTVVLVEHNMNVVMTVSDRITVMHQGAVLAEGTPAEISADKQVQTAYLGALYGDVAAGGGE
jgi:branched-chain amino acid transport system ATP-binding protein